MPKAFGKVGWVIFDESPLDAFMFGVDDNDEMVLALDDLRVRGSRVTTQGKATQTVGLARHAVRCRATGNPLG